MERMHAGVNRRRSMRRGALLTIDVLLEDHGKGPNKRLLELSQRRRISGNDEPSIGGQLGVDLDTSRLKRT